MKAYKGFNADMTCRGFQYKEGEAYKTAEERNYAYAKYCGRRLCQECKLHDKRDKELTCAFHWLALKADVRQCS